MTTHLQFFLIAVAGWMNRHQQDVIAYLQEENRVLLEQLGGKPRSFTNAQRIRLARKAKLVGRHHLGQLATIVTPDTLLRWFRALIAKKWTFARTNPVDRPPVDPELEKLVIKLITENPTWGSNRVAVREFSLREAILKFRQGVGRAGIPWAWQWPVELVAYHGDGKSDARPRILIPPQPIPLPDGSDSVDMWLYGNRWDWENPPGTPPVRIVLHVRDSVGEVHSSGSPTATGAVPGLAAGPRSRSKLSNSTPCWLHR